MSENAAPENNAPETDEPYNHERAQHAREEALWAPLAPHRAPQMVTGPRRFSSRPSNPHDEPHARLHDAPQRRHQLGKLG